MCIYTLTTDSVNIPHATPGPYLHSHPHDHTGPYLHSHRTVTQRTYPRLQRMEKCCVFVYWKVWSHFINVMMWLRGLRACMRLLVVGCAITRANAYIFTRTTNMHHHMKDHMNHYTRPHTYTWFQFLLVGTEYSGYICTRAWRACVFIHLCEYMLWWIFCSDVLLVNNIDCMHKLTDIFTVIPLIYEIKIRIRWSGSDLI